MYKIKIAVMANQSKHGHKYTPTAQKHNACAYRTGRSIKPAKAFQSKIN